MAKKRKHLKPSVKLKLFKDAGNKCANPGCTNWQTHIHHIKNWSVYESDDPGILIALCPSCHNAIHHGTIEITDDVLYSWKGIQREIKPSTTHIYVEPSKEIKLLTGSISISTTNDKVTVFKLSENNNLSFRILNSDIALINLSIGDLRGNEVLWVSDNYVRVHDSDSLIFKQVPGHVIVTTDKIDSFLPHEFLNKMRIKYPHYCEENLLTLLELEVVKPGLVKVKGCWAHNEQAVIITNDAISFVTKGRQQPLSMIGEGENTVLRYMGPIDKELFGFKSSYTGN